MATRHRIAPHKIRTYFLSLRLAHKLSGNSSSGCNNNNSGSSRSSHWPPLALALSHAAFILRDFCCHSAHPSPKHWCYCPCSSCFALSALPAPSSIGQFNCNFSCSQLQRQITKANRSCHLVNKFYNLIAQQHLNLFITKWGMLSVRT